MSLQVEVTIMSGVDDGQHLDLALDNGDGQFDGRRWTLNIGRREDSDICLRHDMFVSRLHAHLHFDGSDWQLEDLNSTNGTFLEARGEDERVTGTVAIQPGQLFRIGRTWLQIEREP